MEPFLLACLSLLTYFNLFQSESGSVEMDAGIMDGSSLLFGAVGAVPGIKNPILVAKLMVEEQQKGLLPLGKVIIVLASQRQ